MLKNKTMFYNIMQTIALLIFFLFLCRQKNFFLLI